MKIYSKILPVLSIILFACSSGGPKDITGAAATGIAACKPLSGNPVVISYFMAEGANGYNSCWESDGVATPPVQFTDANFSYQSSGGPCDPSNPLLLGCCACNHVVSFTYHNGPSYEPESGCSINSSSECQWHDLP